MRLKGFDLQVDDFNHDKVGVHLRINKKVP